MVCVIWSSSVSQCVGVSGRLMLRLHGASGSQSGLGKWYFVPHRFSGHWKFTRQSELSLM